MATDAEPDLLSGHAEIGRHLGMQPRQAKHLSEIKAIPTFKLPGSNIVRARRSSLKAWLAELEGEALNGRKQAHG